MSSSETVIAALKFKCGVVLAAYSQVSDPVGKVRWEFEKLDRIGTVPCVVGFSGSVGRVQRARRTLNEARLDLGAFKKTDTILKVIDRVLTPHYQEIKERWANSPHNLFDVCLWGLCAFWAEGSPQILELEMNGDSSLHNSFRAIGSGSNSAYAVYRTLGGERLCDLEGGKALTAILRILKTSVSVDVAGVSDPYHVWVVSSSDTRKVSDEELNAHLQLLDAWIEREREALFGGLMADA
jgi:20S proteasome alpha/beta subunit